MGRKTAIIQRESISESHPHAGVVMRRRHAQCLIFSSTFFAVLMLGGEGTSWSPSALAQSQPPAGPAMTPEEIAACLCQKEVLDQQQSDTDVQNGLLQERQQQLTNLDAQIKQQAERTPSTDVVGQQLLQDMIKQQIALRNLIQLQIRPAYNQQVNQLRQTIETRSEERRVGKERSHPWA